MRNRSRVAPGEWSLDQLEIVVASRGVTLDLDAQPGPFGTLVTGLDGDRLGRGLVRPEVLRHAHRGDRDLVPAGRDAGLALVDRFVGAVGLDPAGGRPLGVVALALVG